LVKKKPKFGAETNKKPLFLWYPQGVEALGQDFCYLSPPWAAAAW